MVYLAKALESNKGKQIILIQATSSNGTKYRQSQGWHQVSFLPQRFVRYLTGLCGARRATKPKIVSNQIYLNAPLLDHFACTESATEGTPPLDHQRAFKIEKP